MKPVPVIGLGVPTGAAEARQADRVGCFRPGRPGARRRHPRLGGRDDGGRQDAQAAGHQAAVGGHDVRDQNHAPPRKAPQRREPARMLHYGSRQE